jgi:hypothetical protein
MSEIALDGGDLNRLCSIFSFTSNAGLTLFLWRERKVVVMLTIRLTSMEVRNSESEMAASFEKVKAVIKCLPPENSNFTE